MGSKRTATIAPKAGEEAYLQIGEVAERTVRPAQRAEGRTGVLDEPVQLRPHRRERGGQPRAGVEEARQARRRRKSSR